MPVVVADELLGREKQQRLFDASRKYMAGEISVSDLNDAERLYMPNYKKAMLTLAKIDRLHERGLRADVWRWLRLRR